MFFTKHTSEQVEQHLAGDSTVRILVIDDDHIIRESLSALLKVQQHAVEVADGLKTGRGALRKSPYSDVLLSDFEFQDGTAAGLTDAPGFSDIGLRILFTGQPLSSLPVSVTCAFHLLLDKAGPTADLLDPISQHAMTKQASASLHRPYRPPTHAD